jgi:hypothetical protein
MLKALVLAVASLPVCALATNPAELTPGTLELSGSASLQIGTGSTKVKPDLAGAEAVKTDTGEYVLDVGGFYYVTPSVGLGLSVSYEKQTEESDGLDERSQLLTIGPALSLQLPVAPSLAVFGRGTIGYARSRLWGAEMPDLEGHGYGYSVEGGLRYYPIAQLSIDLGLSYTHAKLTTDAASTPVESIPKIEGTSSGLTASVGLSVYLGR